MVFSSYVFILAFMPIVLAGYFLLSFLKNSIYQRIFLIAASLFFYGYYNIKYLALIIASIAVNYIVASQIQKSRGNKLSKYFLSAGVVFNVALIGYFKYCDFFIENINLVFGRDFALRHILLPLGISFFTFQQLSFLVSVYKGEEKVERLRDYCLFVTFFPQLVAGPIVLYSEMIPQFKDESRRYFNANNFAAGIYLFSIGLFKKAVIADTLALFADNGFGMTNLGFIAGWITSLSYTLQIYFDFSGYSDMAVGLGRMFNIEIPFNFLSPYRSESISEFWRRWHITLGRALSTYVYKPLGGNRKGLVRTCINLLLTFFVSGLWHGAAWTFVLWGMLHGAFAVVERIAGKRLDAIPKLIRIFATFMIVNALWVLFRAEGFSQAIEVYRGMLAFGNMEISQLDTIVGLVGYMKFPMIANCVYILGLEAFLLMIVFKYKNSSVMLQQFTATRKNLLSASLFFTVALLCLTRESVFIYFNF
ncbi:MBOAT family protein [bacterium]|nr:MBOAT family protein [bacterium]